MVRDIPKEVICKCDNRGMNVSGEYDIESNMHCPNCNEVVGDYESNDLWCKYCPECGQRLKYTELKNEDEECSIGGKVMIQAIDAKKLLEDIKEMDLEYMSQNDIMECLEDVINKQSKIEIKE